MLTTLMLSAALAQPTLSNDQFVGFMESYRQLHPDQVTLALTQLSAEQQQWLGIWNGLGSHIYTRACHGSYAAQIVFPAASGPQTCQHLLYYEAFNANNGYAAGAIQYADTQRMEIVNMMRCSSGQYDAATCSAYMGATQTYNQATNDIGQSIVDSMAPPPCTAYYDQGGGYLGCW